MTEDSPAENPFEGILGLEISAVRLYPYTTRWAELYQEEAARLQQALGSTVIAIEHYGSTAVPGLSAKPILDILVGVERFEDGSRCIPLLEAIGYDYAPRAGIPGDWTFGRGVRRTHLVHVVEYGGRNWTDNLRFRDALRRDLALAREYEALKTRLAAECGHSRAAYTAGKSAFVQRVLAVTSGLET